VLLVSVEVAAVFLLGELSALLGFPSCSMVLEEALTAFRRTGGDASIKVMVLDPLLRFVDQILMEGKVLVRLAVCCAAPESQL